MGASWDTSVAHQVLAAARLMYERGLVTGSAGNVSARDRAHLIITPTRRYYDEIDVGDLVRIALDAAPRNGVPPDASLEWAMHVAVYAARPDVGAIVHTHSPCATARSFDTTPLHFLTEEREYLGLDGLHVAPEARPGAPELPGLVVRALGDRPACLLARHGVVTTGDRPRTALEIAAAVEHQAHVQQLVAASGRSGPDARVLRAVAAPRRG